MFCEDCGKKIDQDSVFCEYCGSKVKKISSIITKENKVILILLVFIFFVFLFLWELKCFNSPDNAMNHYLKNWKNHNYDVLIQDLGVEDGPFTTTELFQKAFSKKEEFSIYDFQIRECFYGINKESATCQISYQKNKNGFNYEKTYYLKRNKKNKLFLFADWVIEEHSFQTLKDYVLFLPSNSTATLENIDMSDYRSIDKDKTGYDAYTIPQIFEGTYLLHLKMSNGIDLEKEININKQEYTYQFNIQDISRDYQEQVKSLGVEVIETLYNGVAKGKKFEEITCKRNISSLKGIYENLQKSLSKSFLTSLKVLDMKVTKFEINKDGKIFISFQMDYEYELNIQTNGKNETHQGKSSDVFYMTVKDIELNEIENIDSLVTYFSKKY